MYSFREPIDLALNFSSLTKLDSCESNLQDIVLYKHPLLGKILVINKEIHHVESWAPLYHEMVVHLPIAFIPEIRSVLILGGGSLFAAAEVLKYQTIERVLMIDHDKEVINLIKKNYTHAHDIFNDKRFELHINDAFVEVSEIQEQFDLIVNDAVDLITQSKKMKIDLFKTLDQKLNENGVCSDVIYRHIFERTRTLKTLNILKKSFNSMLSLIAVPEYPGIFHILCLWSRTNKYLNNKILVNDIQKGWIKNESDICLYYNPKFLNYYCYLPPYLGKSLENIPL